MLSTDKIKSSLFTRSMKMFLHAMYNICNKLSFCISLNKCVSSLLKLIKYFFKHRVYMNPWQIQLLLYYYRRFINQGSLFLLIARIRVFLANFFRHTFANSDFIYCRENNLFSRQTVNKQYMYFNFRN